MGQGFNSGGGGVHCACSTHALGHRGQYESGPVHWTVSSVEDHSRAQSAGKETLASVLVHTQSFRSYFLLFMLRSQAVKGGEGEGCV